MNPNETQRGKGELIKIAGVMRQSGEALVRYLQITPPVQVLDLKYGNVKLLKIVSSHTTLPLEGFARPVKRCMETHIVERFGQAGVPAGSASNVRETYHLILPNKDSVNFVGSVGSTCAVAARFMGVPGEEAFSHCENETWQ